MWAYVKGSIERKSLSDKKEEQEKLSKTCKEEIHTTQATWDKDDGMVVGKIMLRLNPIVQQNHTNFLISYLL